VEGDLTTFLAEHFFRRDKKSLTKYIQGDYFVDEGDTCRDYSQYEIINTNFALKLK